MEKWDIYDENEKRTGRFCYRETHDLKDGEYHLGVQTWIVNSKGELLLTQRAATKDTNPLLWECTCGSALYGEDAKAGMIRELKEEIGLSVKREELEVLEVFKNPDRHVIIYIFTMKKDLEISDLIFSDKEVIDAKWVTKEELNKMNENNELVPARALKYFL